jgi:hypothetical protein
MGNTEEELMYLNNTKNLINEAISNKGVAIPEDAPFRQYASYVGQIREGGSVSGTVYTVDFIWRSVGTGEIVRRRYYVEHGGSVSKPAGFNESDFVGAGDYPAMYYLYTSGDETKLNNVTENLVITS